MMKFAAIFTILLSLMGCLAQRSFISLPTAGTKITPGQQITVQVRRPNSIQGSIEVGMVIGLLQCQQIPCPPPSAQLGSIVFNGQFNPQFHEIPGEPYENFTVTVPSFQASFGTTTAQLATARLHLIGAGPSPVLELNNVTLKIKF